MQNFFRTYRQKFFGSYIQFLRTYKKFSEHIIIFPKIQKFFPTYHNSFSENTKFFPTYHNFYFRATRTFAHHEQFSDKSENNLPILALHFPNLWWMGGGGILHPSPLTHPSSYAPVYTRFLGVKCPSPIVFFGLVELDIETCYTMKLWMQQDKEYMVKNILILLVRFIRTPCTAKRVYIWAKRAKLNNLKFYIVINKIACQRSMCADMEIYIYLIIPIGAFNNYRDMS